MKIYFTLFLISISFITYSQSPWLIKDINSTNPVNQLYDGTIIGSNSSTAKFGDDFPKNMYNVNGAALFFADNGIGGRGLYRTDGTSNGTYLLSTLGVLISDNIRIDEGTEFSTGKLLYFEVINNTADTDSSTSLWRSDGTTSGTYSIITSGPDLNLNDDCEVQIGNLYYFHVAQGNQTQDSVFNAIYKTDGTKNGTSLYYRFDSVAESLAEYDNFGGSPLMNFIGFNNKIYYNYNNQIYNGDGVDAPSKLPNAIGATLAIVNNWANVNSQYLIINASSTIADANIGKSQLLRLYPSDIAPVALGNGTGIKLNYNGYPEIVGNKIFFIVGDSIAGVTNGEMNGTFNITLQNYYLGVSTINRNVQRYVGVNSAGVLINGMFETQGGIFIWDGNSPSSYKLLAALTDSLVLNGDGISTIVSFGDTLLAFGTGVYQADVNNSYCYRVENLQTGDFLNPSGLILNNNYVSFASGRGSYTGIFEFGTEPTIIRPFKKIWTGASSTDWNTAGNWLGNVVPTSTDDVVIPPITNSPIVSTNASCRNLTVNFSTLTVNKPGNLDVNGYVANYGNQGSTSSLAMGSNINGTGSLTRVGGYSNKTYGAGFYNIDSININGADWDLTSMSTSFPDDIHINSIINFKSDNKLIMNYLYLVMTKKPFFTGYNNKRFVLDNRISAINNFENIPFPIVLDLFQQGVDSSNFIMPIGSNINSYTPVSITFPFSTVDGVNASVDILDTINYHNNPSPFAGVVNKTWQPYVFGFGSFDTLQLGWGAADEGSGFNRNSCFIAYYNGTSWVKSKVQAAVLKNGIYSISDTIKDVDINKGVIVASNSGSLPVQLINFTAKLIESNALLDWQTVTEINSKYFNIERSTDGVNFINIGKENAAGNSNSALSYSYIDNIESLNGTIYYRLAETDIDGKITLSEVRTITIPNNKLFTISPNPARGFVIISGENLEQINVYDASGKLQIVRAVNNQNTFSLNISALSKGQYFVELTTTSGNKETKKLIVY